MRCSFRVEMQTHFASRLTSWLARVDLEALDNPVKLERIPPKKNRRTKLDMYNKAHKGGQAIRQQMTPVELDDLITRRDSELLTTRRTMSLTRRESSPRSGR